MLINTQPRIRVKREIVGTARLQLKGICIGAGGRCRVFIVQSTSHLRLQTALRIYREFRRVFCVISTTDESETELGVSRVAIGGCERSNTALIFGHRKTGGGRLRERIRLNGCRNPRARAFIVLGTHLHLIRDTFYQVVQQCDFVIAGCITDLPRCEILARCRYCVCGTRPCIGSAILPNPHIVAGDRRFPCHIGRLPEHHYARIHRAYILDNKVGNCPGWFSRVCHRDGNCLVFRSCPSPPFCSCETIRNP